MHALFSWQIFAIDNLGGEKQSQFYGPAISKPRLVLTVTLGAGFISFAGMSHCFHLELRWVMDQSRYTWNNQMGANAAINSQRLISPDSSRNHR